MVWSFVGFSDNFMDVLLNIEKKCTCNLRFDNFGRLWREWSYDEPTRV